MKIPLLFFIVLAVCAGLEVPAHAEMADRSKPMNIEADTLRYDDVKQVNTFTGNVILTKGSIVVRAARIEVRQDADGYQHSVINGSPEKPAFFRQKREGMDEYIEGESATIEYDGHADTVKFVGSAVLRRLRGAVLADEITGGLIVYENLTDLFSVDGNATKGVGLPQRGRVRAMLTPKSEPVASMAPAAASAPTVPTLRTTNTLGGVPK